MNLAVNARDAMPDGGRLTIQTANVEPSEGSTAAPNRDVMLVVSDTGCGMNAETQARMFEPFFTTKDQGKGTGLGLATVHGIVEQSGGRIFVSSQPGKGTSFIMYFPRVEEDTREHELSDIPSAPVHGEETILLVEDDAMVRGLVRTILQGSGYHVLEAQNGSEGLRVCETHAGSVDLLVTDIVMPGMSGTEFADHLVSRSPKTKVLYISGYLDKAIACDGALKSPAACLHKPFTPDLISRKVREVLDLTGDAPSPSQDKSVRVS